MPKFLETKLKKEYGEKSAVPFKVMNSLGAMRGNKETAKGRAMEHKHERDTSMKKPAAEHMREMRIEIHRGPAPSHKVTGFTVHHNMEPKTTKSAAFMEHTSHTQPFSAKEHESMMDHVQEHLEGVMGGAKENAAKEPAGDEEEEEA